MAADILSSEIQSWKNHTKQATEELLAAKRSLDEASHFQARLVCPFYP